MRTSGEKCAVEVQVCKGCGSRVLKRFEWKCELAMEGGKGYEGKKK